MTWPRAARLSCQAPRFRATCARMRCKRLHHLYPAPWDKKLHAQQLISPGMDISEEKVNGSIRVGTTGMTL